MARTGLIGMIVIGMSVFFLYNLENFDMEFRILGGVVLLLIFLFGLRSERQAEQEYDDKIERVRRDRRRRMSD